MKTTTTFRLEFTNRRNVKIYNDPVQIVEFVEKNKSWLLRATDEPRVLVIAYVYYPLRLEKLKNKLVSLKKELEIVQEKKESLPQTFINIKKEIEELEGLILKEGRIEARFDMEERS